MQRIEFRAMLGTAPATEGCSGCVFEHSPPLCLMAPDCTPLDEGTIFTLPDTPEGWEEDYADFT